MYVYSINQLFGYSIIMDYICDKEFDKINLLEKGEYENCRFVNCNFAEADFSEFMFVNCHFTSSNLSLVKTMKTAFQNVIFKDCKMLGLHFESCNPFALSIGFYNSLLNHSSFYQMKIKKTIFKDSQLHEV